MSYFTELPLAKRQMIMVSEELGGLEGIRDCIDPLQNKLFHLQQCDKAVSNGSISGGPAVPQPYLNEIAKILAKRLGEIDKGKTNHQGLVEMAEADGETKEGTDEHAYGLAQLHCSWKQAAKAERVAESTLRGRAERHMTRLGLPHPFRIKAEMVARANRPMTDAEGAATIGKMAPVENCAGMDGAGAWRAGVTNCTDVVLDELTAKRKWLGEMLDEIGHSGGAVALAGCPLGVQHANDEFNRLLRFFRAALEYQENAYPLRRAEFDETGKRIVDDLSPLHLEYQNLVRPLLGRLTAIEGEAA